MKKEFNIVTDMLLYRYSAWIPIIQRLIKHLSNPSVYSFNMCEIRGLSDKEKILYDQLTNYYYGTGDIKTFQEITEELNNK